MEIQGLFFYLSVADFHGFTQFGKPSGFAAGDEHLAGDDFIQHEILPSRVQLTEHVVSQQHRLLPPFPLHQLPLGKL